MSERALDAKRKKMLANAAYQHAQAQQNATTPNQAQQTAKANMQQAKRRRRG